MLLSRFIYIELDLKEMKNVFQLNVHNSSSFLNVINKNIKIRIEILTRCLLTNVTTPHHLTPEAYSLIQIERRSEGNLLSVQSRDDREFNLISVLYENYNLSNKLGKKTYIFVDRTPLKKISRENIKVSFMNRFLTVFQQESAQQRWNSD